MGVGLWSLLTALFRMIPRFPPARSARECATSAAPAHAGISRAVPRRCNPAHMLSSPETTPPETLTDTHPVPDVLTHHNLDAEPDRSRRGLRPISAQVSTDLEPELDRSRRGLRPISTTLGGAGSASALHNDQLVEVGVAVARRVRGGEAAVQRCIVASDLPAGRCVCPARLSGRSSGLSG